VLDSDAGPAQLQADFPAAALRQGGNWIGNTGYGYGDSDLIAYSERLSLLFASTIGRYVDNGEGGNRGATIGESLTRAKRIYLRTAGPSGFGVYDEKALLEMTLYGLPFITVMVPTPTTTGSLSEGGSEPAPQARPASAPVLGGQFTRIITFENTLSLDSVGRGSVPRATSRVQDTFVPNSLASPIAIEGHDQSSAGRPVLPLLDYDMTVEGPGGPLDPVRPQVRGVRLIEARSDPIEDGFRPHVTNIVTDDTYLLQQQMPSLEPLQGSWLPELPYNYVHAESVGDDVAPHDVLLVSPAQVRPTAPDTAQLRRFTRMVFEVSYVDPSQASAATLRDTQPPLISRPRVEIVGVGAQSRALTQVRFSASVSDAQSSELEVSLTYTVDGGSWTQRFMTYNRSTGRFELDAALPSGGAKVVGIIEARDSHGNIASETARGQFLGLKLLNLPLVVR
jgi:hypothetical protein